jgi:D-methionine transport system ATP-binding protein
LFQPSELREFPETLEAMMLDPSQGATDSDVLRAADPPILLLEGVSKSYARPGGGKDRLGAIEALKGVDLTVPRGTIQGIIGFSGAGKTTLLRCISGLEKPDAGRVVVAGTDLAHLDGEALRLARRQIGVVFQHLNLLHSRTVYANVALGLEMAGGSKAEIKERVTELLTWFGLEDKAKQYPSQLSGGQRQRVAVARALALQPAVLLTDEPTSALDNETTTSVLNLLRRVRDEFRVTILLITHDLEAVRAICDRVAVLEAGRIVEEGPIEDVFLTPTSSAAQRLLHSPSELDAVPPTATGLQSLVLQVKVVGDLAAEPLLSDLTTLFGVQVNILRAQIDRLNNTPYAFFVVRVSGSEEALERSIASLTAKGVAVSRLAPPNDRLQVSA